MVRGVVTLVLGVLLGGGPADGRQTGAGPAAATPAATVAERFLLAAANQDRLRLGLRPLELDPGLNLAARRHALLMARYATISHRFEGEPGLVERVAGAGAHVARVSENVAESPDAGQIHELWMHSAGHRANLLDPAVDRVGISVISVRGQSFAVEDFASLVESLSLEQQELRVAALLRQAGVEVLPTTSAARESCSQEHADHAARPGFTMRYTASSLAALPPELEVRLRSRRYRQAVVGACNLAPDGSFSGYSVAVLLFP